MMKATGEENMKIQDVEINTGLDRATIRFYENENNLTLDRFENG